MASVEQVSGIPAEEAVIISGPRRGDIVHVVDDEVVLSPEEDQALDVFLAQVQRTAKTLSDTVEAMRVAREEYRVGQRELHGGA